MLILGQDKELIVDAQVADVVAQGCNQKPENCDLASSTTASPTLETCDSAAAMPLTGACRT